MPSQKRENLLNLALQADEEERAKSLELETGYNPISRQWQLIIKYSGDLMSVRNVADEVVELVNEYAIITISESRIDQLTSIPEVEYIEKPKRLFFQVANGRRVSCIQEVQGTRLSLYGEGVLIGIVDSGIDYANDDFRNADGTTRIRSLWDQSISAAGDDSPPEGYAIGVEYTQERINEALQQPTLQAQRTVVPSQDTSGHGTAVAGIAAGNGRNSQGQYAGVAPESELLIVKMGTPMPEGFPRTTELMMGIDYVIRQAMKYGMPVAVNISFGNTYGAHNGTSLLERFIDDISNMWKNSICIGTGNEAASAGHTSGRATEEQEDVIELAIQNRQTALSVQIWKSYADVIDITLITPSGVSIGPIQEMLGTQRYTVGSTELLVYYGEPSPYSVSQEIYIDMLPRDTYITGGVWRIVLTPRQIVTGEYQMWLPSENVLNQGTGFLNPTNAVTLTIPSTSSRAISVGAYNALNFTYADFSGRGVPIGQIEGTYVGLLPAIGGVKPDLAAPGVEVTTTTVGGGYAAYSGTSFAAPFVTGSAALLMEWGIVQGNDPYLYGEKVKAYLRRGARELPGFAEYPNNQVGYGALCVRESLPM